MLMVKNQYCCYFFGIFAKFMAMKSIIVGKGKCVWRYRPLYSLENSVFSELFIYLFVLHDHHDHCATSAVQAAMD